ncbi:MAG: hypothetical protein HXS51_12985, partial [Theionarchaea archaeon]|nr:hypothetical protein [Theionarchaea archaeon]
MHIFGEKKMCMSTALWEQIVQEEIKMRNKVNVLAITAVLILGMGLDGLLAAVVDGEDERIFDLNVSQPVTTNIPPVVEVVPDVSSGKAPLHVKFEGDVYDEDGELARLEWDFEGDGAFEVSRDLENIERPQ